MAVPVEKRKGSSSRLSLCFFHNEILFVVYFVHLFVCLFANSDMSIPEDIEEQLSSLNGYFTSDRTVSQASGEDLDFAEDILNF